MAYKTFKTKSNSKTIIKIIHKKINFKNLIIAYEPVWAIGSNQTPSLGEIENVHGYIKKFFLKIMM